MHDPVLFAAMHQRFDCSALVSLQQNSCPLLDALHWYVCWESSSSNSHTMCTSWSIPLFNLPSFSSKHNLDKKKKKLQLNFEAMMRVQTWLSAFGGVLFLLCSEEKELSVLYFFLIYVNFNFLCACAYMCPVLVPQKLKPRPLGWSQYVWPYGVILRSCCSAFADE